MVRLFQWLFFGHVHKWKTIETRELHVAETKSRGSRHIQQCEKCGIVVKRDLI